MSALHIPRRNIAYPCGPLRLCESHPLAARIFHAFVPNGPTFVDVAGGFPVSNAESGQTTTFEEIATAGGYAGSLGGVEAVRMGTSTAGFILPNLVSPIHSLTSSDAFTLLVLGGSLAAEGEQKVLMGYFDPWATGTGVTLQYDDNAATGPGRIRLNGIYSASNVLTNPIRGKVHFFGGAFDHGNGIKFFHNGITSYTASATSLPTPVANHRVHVLAPGGGSTNVSANAFVAFGLFIHGVVSDAEWADLYDDPYSIFTANPIRFYSLASGGIPTLSALAAGNVTSTGCRASVSLAF